MPRSPSPSARRDRSRSRSPPRQKKVRELSFYKKSSSSSGGGVGSFSSRRDPLAVEEETAKDRAERRERGEVPARFGGTREQGVRNTMGNVGGSLSASGGGAGGMGSFKRSADPLDRMGVRGEPSGAGERGDRERDDYRRSGDDRSYRRDERERGDRRDRDMHRDRERRHGDDSRRHRDGDRDKHRERDGDREQRKEIDRPSAPTPNAASSLGPPDRRPAAAPTSAPPPAYGRMIEVIANDRMGRKVRVKCLPTDTVGDLKKLIAAQTGTVAQKIQLKKWYTNFKDHIALQDYEINDGMSLEMY